MKLNSERGRGQYNIIYSKTRTTSIRTSRGMQWSVFASRRVLGDEGVVTVGEGGAVARHGVEVDASLQDVGRALADAGVRAEGVGQEHVVPAPPLLHLPVPGLLQLLEQRLGVHQCGGARHWNSTRNNTGQNTGVNRDQEVFESNLCSFFNSKAVPLKGI